MKRMIGVLLAALALDAGTKWLASELLAGRTVALGWLVELAPLPSVFTQAGSGKGLFGRPFIATFM